MVLTHTLFERLKFYVIDVIYVIQSKVQLLAAFIEAKMLNYCVTCTK